MGSSVYDGVCQWVGLTTTAGLKPVLLLKDSHMSSFGGLFLESFSFLREDYFALLYGPNFGILEVGGGRLGSRCFRMQIPLLITLFHSTFHCAWYPQAQGLLTSVSPKNQEPSAGMGLGGGGGEVPH